MHVSYCFYAKALVSFSILCNILNVKYTSAFQNVLRPHNNILTNFQTQQVLTSNTELHAAKKKKKGSKRATRNKIGNRTKPSSGFGGAAMETCPCGFIDPETSSALPYMKCCGKIHKNASEYAKATPEQVVRARYSAYAKREVDFIVGSTHPLNEKNFQADIDHWKRTIRENCYDNFELTECEILSQIFYKGTNEEEEVPSIDPDDMTQIAKVQFIARLTQVDSREKTAFMETSTFQRAGKNIREGAWMYKDGEVEPLEEIEVDEDEFKAIEEEQAAEALS